MTTDQIDRLAEFCELKTKGYERDQDGEWVPVAAGLDRLAWLPDISDDDCRVVLEAFYAKANSCKKSDLIKALAKIACADVTTETWVEFLLLATPEQKCQAILKVIK